MVRVGVRAIPVVSLVVFAIGAILSLQIVPILRQYGAQDEVARIISIAMFRELGPLVGAIVLTRLCRGQHRRRTRHDGRRRGD